MFKIIFTNNFYEFWILNTIGRSKKLKVGYKWTITRWHDFFITTTLSIFKIYKLESLSFNSLQEHDFKQNEAVKVD